MYYILVIWTIVAMNGGGGTSTKEVAMGWRPIGEFQHQAGCERAAAELGITDPKHFRCLKKTGT